MRYIFIAVDIGMPSFDKTASAFSFTAGFTLKFNVAVFSIMITSLYIQSNALVITCQGVFLHNSYTFTISSSSSAIFSMCFLAKTRYMIGITISVVTVA